VNNYSSASDLMSEENREPLYRMTLDLNVLNHFGGGVLQKDMPIPRVWSYRGIKNVFRDYCE